jgi:hypothetical protein
VHIADLDGTAAPQKGGWRATVTITVRDDAELVSGALVTGQWSGGASGNGSCTTVSGVCRVTSPAIRRKSTSVVWTVTDVTAAGKIYDQLMNSDPDLPVDSDGTTITVLSP